MFLKSAGGGCPWWLGDKEPPATAGAMHSVADLGKSGPRLPQLEKSPTAAKTQHSQK